MPHFFIRFSAAALAFIFAFSSLQFSAENLVDQNIVAGVYAANRGQTTEVVTPANPAQNPTDNPAGGGGDSGTSEIDEAETDSTLGKAQSELIAQEMRGYQSLYEMQAELFAECVAKLKSWDGVLRDPETNKPAGEETEWPAGAVTDLDKICAEEFIEMNEQGPQRLLLYDASGEQPATGQSENWWGDVLGYWFGKEGGLLPELKQTYTETLRSVTAPAADPKNAELKQALENWYGAANSLGGNEFLWHYLVTKNQLHAVPFQQGIVTISNCPNPSVPIFANQDCVQKEWENRIDQLNNQRARLIQEIEKQLKDTDTQNNAKDLIAWYAADDTEMLEAYGLKEINANRNPLQLDIQKLSFLVGLLEQLAKYSATVAYQLELKDSSGGMGIYGNFSTTNAGVDIAQITNLSGKENMTLSQTISKLSNTMVIIGLAIMIPIIVYAGFLMVLSGYDYEQYERGNELLWKVLPWAGFLYITSFQDESRLEEAKKVILMVIVGVALVGGSYAIVSTIVSQVF